MSAHLTPLARHAGLAQSTAHDHSALPWMRTAAGLQHLADADKTMNHGPVDAAAARAAYRSKEYADGHRDGLIDGREVGEREGTLRGFWWGAGCGAFAASLLALIAGFALANWDASKGLKPAPLGNGKAPAITTPAAPAATSPQWSGRS